MRVKCLNNFIFILGKYGYVKVDLHKFKFWKLNYFFVPKSNMFPLLLEALIGIVHKWYFKINWSGMGFKIFSVDNFLFIDLGYAHYFKYNIKQLNLNVLATKYHTRSCLLVIGSCRKLICNFIYSLLKLRLYHRYKSSGLSLSNEVLFKRRYVNSK